MGKPGRKRDPNAKREANGRAQRSETAWMNKQQVLERRCAQLGLRPTVENIKLVDKFGGTFWGLCHIGGMLSIEQYEKAVAFAEARAGFLRAIGAPPPTCKVASYGGGGGLSLVKDSPDRDRASISAYNAMVKPISRDAEIELIHFIEKEELRNVRLVLVALDAI